MNSAPMISFYFILVLKTLQGHRRITHSPYKCQDFIDRSQKASLVILKEKSIMEGKRHEISGEIKRI